MEGLECPSFVKCYDDLVAKLQKNILKRKKSYQCPICPPSFFVPTKLNKALLHLKSHWNFRIQCEDVSILQCRLQCNGKDMESRSPHFHCPQCSQIFNSRKSFKNHLTRLPCLVLFSESRKAGCSQSKEKTQACDFVVTSLDEMLLRMKQRICTSCSTKTIPGSDVPHIHCHLCPRSPPIDVSVVDQHIQEIHASRSVKHKGLTYLMCKKSCQGNKSREHFHCKYCTKVFKGGLDFEHLMKHRAGELSINRPGEIFHTLTSVISPDLMDYIPADKQAICDTLQHKFNVRCSLLSDRLCVKASWDKMSKLYNFLSPLVAKVSKDIDVNQVESIFQEFSKTADDNNVQVEKGGNEKLGKTLPDITSHNINEADDAPNSPSDLITPSGTNEPLEGSLMKDKSIETDQDSLPQRHVTQNIEMSSSPLKDANNEEYITPLKCDDSNEAGSALKGDNKLKHVSVCLKDCMRTEAHGDNTQPKNLKSSRTKRKSARITQYNTRQSKRVKLCEKGNDKIIPNDAQEKTDTETLKIDLQTIRTIIEEDFDDSNDFDVNDIDSIANSDDGVKVCDVKDVGLNEDLNIDYFYTTNNVIKDEIDNIIDAVVKGARVDGDQNIDDSQIIHTENKDVVSNDETLPFQEEDEKIKITLQVEKPVTETETEVRAENRKDKSVKKVKEIKKFTCELCNKSFTRRSYLRFHIEKQICIRHPKLPEDRICQFCGKELKTPQGLRYHLKNQACQKEKKPQQEYIQGDTYLCNVCGKEFPGKYHLKIHHRYVHEGHTRKKSQCPECGKIINQQNLKTHIQDIHYPGSKSYKCEECGSCFTRPSSLNHHVLTVHKLGYIPKKHHCLECNKAFAKRCLLKEHMFTHRGDRPVHQCSKCDKSFAYRGDLSKHNKSHLGLTYACEICDISFKTKHILRKHCRAKHYSVPSTSEVLFPCQCGEVFLSKSKLLKHEGACKSVHESNEIQDVEQNGVVITEKFVCALCSLMFDTMDEVNEHLQTHLDEENARLLNAL
ncbi:unnamed protein product [Owenia fusiformis]|uniref:Uncharacterized protein n=1 Tax=Owenia fusiformis TaxID=6347 RepID=A0A8J1Y825_OWEFU|nr:unnamed protein product [Owenia fusiformis]